MPNRVGLPIDGNSRVAQLTPPRLAVAVTVDDSVAVATDVSLNSATTFIEVTALNAGIYMRYAATAAANAFDEYIIANTVRHFYVPTGVTTVSFIQDAVTGTALLRLIEK